MASAMVIGVNDERPRFLRVDGTRVVVVDGIPPSEPNLCASHDAARQNMADLAKRAETDGQPAVGGEYEAKHTGIFGTELLERIGGLLFKASLLNFVRRRHPKATWRTLNDGEWWCAVAFDGGAVVGFVCGYKG